MWTRYVTHTNVTRTTFECVMSHVWISSNININESCHTRNESCHTYECFEVTYSHVWHASFKCIRMRDKARSHIYTHICNLYIHTHTHVQIYTQKYKCVYIHIYIYILICRCWVCGIWFSLLLGALFRLLWLRSRVAVEYVSWLTVEYVIYFVVEYVIEFTVEYIIYLTCGYVMYL